MKYLFVIISGYFIKATPAWGMANTHHAGVVKTKNISIRVLPLGFRSSGWTPGNRFLFHATLSLN
jgi:hypothetical protein